MRCIFGIAFAAMVSVVLVSCGGGSKAKKRAPVGPTFQETFAVSKESAARSVLLGYAGQRRELAVEEVSRLVALLPVPPGGTSGAGPGVGGPGPSGPAPAGPTPFMPPGMYPPGPSTSGPHSVTGPGAQPGMPGPAGPPPIDPKGPPGLPPSPSRPGAEPGGNPAGSPPPVLPGVQPGGGAPEPTGPPVAAPDPRTPKNKAPAPAPAPAVSPEELIKAQGNLGRWESLINALKKGKAATVFVVKEWESGEAGKDQASSRLVLSLKGAYAGLADGDLSFDLRWKRTIRPPTFPGDAERADWELQGFQPKTDSGDRKPE